MNFYALALALGLSISTIAIAMVLVHALPGGALFWIGGHSGDSRRETVFAMWQDCSFW